MAHLLFSAVWVLAFFITHIFVQRLRALKKESRQLLLLKLVFLFAFACVATSYFLTQDLLTVLFHLTIFMGFSWSYFSWFNMSETARRIHLLVCLYEANVLGQNDAAVELHNYNERVMVDRRIERLLETGSVNLLNQKYFAKKSSSIMIWTDLFKILQVFYPRLDRCKK